MSKSVLSTSIGSKTLMALSGLGLLGFSIVHLCGWLLIFAGEDSLNQYAQKLQDLGPLLWVARLGLLGIFALHLGAAWKVTRENQEARPVAYAKKERIHASFASSTMVYSGILILLFVMYHLAHFTFHWVGGFELELDSLGRRNIYRMVVQGFSDPLVSGLYFFAMAVLGLHLSHGISSIFQTLGLAYSKKFWLKVQKLGLGLAWAIALGYMMIPLSVLTGLVK